MDKLKKCTKCKEILPDTTDFFYYDSKWKKLSAQCKNCKKGVYKGKEVTDIKKWYDERDNFFKSKWSFKDIKWMYDNYLSITKQELLDYFDNTIPYKTLTNIIYKWGLKKTIKNDNWSKKEIESLKKYYPDKEQTFLESFFKDRSWVSIKMKASKLGIQRTDEALFTIRSESHIGIKPSEEARRKMSQSRKGKNNPNWKGNCHIVPHFRSQLYEWKLDSLKSTDYKCYFTAIHNDDLQIHHVNKNFIDIMEESFIKCGLSLKENIEDYSNEELDSLNKCFLDLHYQYGLGVPMQEYIHKSFHSIYGHTNNTPEQFKQFESMYKIGMIDKLLNKSLKEYQLKVSTRKKRNKLTSEDVLNIRELISEGIKVSTLAEQYGVSPQTIRDLKNYKTWSHIS
ncbi:MAG: NUMOD3 domain-containing DNA-binding protein [Romboutsia sp.]